MPQAQQGHGWRAQSLRVTQVVPNVVLAPELLLEKDGHGRFRRVILCGFGVTAGVTILVGSSESDLRRGIGMPLGAAYLYIDLRPEEELRAAATSLGVAPPETLRFRVEVLDGRGG